ncbi:ATP-binding protein [Solidesulfovibrio sp.]|uniref:ATP-binding protein n=1 Tax=Solidesulfovibrio sp. TaxID=2910990 RepID=UPI002634BEE0|nr:ATP-binding protein [Solidesulfovibrio sp.]
MSRLFRKTLLAVVLVFGVAANATALLSAWLLHRHLTDEYVTTGRAIAMAIAAGSPDALAAGDAAAVQAMIDEFLHIDGVGYVFVTDRQERVVAHTFVPAMPAALAGGPAPRGVAQLALPNLGEFIQVTAPILAGEGGSVSVGMDKAGIWRIMRGAVMGQEALMLAMLLVAVVVFYALIGGIVRPLAELAGYAVKIRDHDFSATPPRTGDDEVGLLARAMQSMASQLSQLVSDLTRDVADATRGLQSSLAHTRAIIDNLADGLLVLDADGLVTLHNPALLAMFGRLGGEPDGRPAAESFPRELADLAEAARKEGRLAVAEVGLAEGGTGKAVATAVRLAGEAREVVIILVRDVTVEKEVDRMKTEFISTVSHELRTPLTSVLGFAKIIRRKFGDAVAPALAEAKPATWRAAQQIRENLDIIVAEGQRLTELVDDVLDIAKMESGRCEWDMAPLSLADAAGHAVRAVQGLARDKGLTLACELPPSLPRIVGDRDRLVQVFVNLVGNAVKFTASGGVRIEARVEGPEIVVAVRDTGCGIAPDDLERIFEKFKQAGDTLTEKPKGTGLGLPICRQIVERHGGRIWAENAPGRGSVFYFTLPIPGVLQEGAACPLPAWTPPAVPAASRDGRGRVLVVDDDAAVRRFLETLLTDAGYVAATAASGVEALSLAASWRPDCVTMDLRMPGMDGREAIRRLRADPATRRIPVLVVSVASRREGVASGADAAVVKPVTQEAFLDTVRGLLEGRQAVPSRPCLLYARNGEGVPVKRFYMCPGESLILYDEAELWRVVEQGFEGTVFIPASLGHDLDLERLCAAPGVHVVLFPDEPAGRES